MKTLSAVLKSNPLKQSLINAVINRIGITNVPHVVKNPVAGFPGFIYPHDTIKFYHRHQKTIDAWVLEISDIYAPTYLEDFSNKFGLSKGYNGNVFKCIKAYLQGETLPEEPLAYVENLLTIFALWQVCKLFS